MQAILSDSSLPLLSGYKYVYPAEQQTALGEFITERIFEHFPEANLDYFT
jgi:hypothetical protein